MRDQALALACLRHGFPTAHARGVDQLPADVAAPWEASLVRQLEPAELARAFQAALDGLLREIRHADAEAAERLEAPLRSLTGNWAGDGGIQTRCLNGFLFFQQVTAPVQTRCLNRRPEALLRRLFGESGDVRAAWVSFPGFCRKPRSRNHSIKRSCQVPKGVPLRSVSPPVMWLPSGRVAGMRPC